MAEEATTEEGPVPGSDEYNESMAAKAQAARDYTDQPDLLPADTNPMPEGGHEKFYNKETGEYDWPNHAKELQYRLENQSGEKEPTQEDTKDSSDDQVSNIVSDAGLSMDDLGEAIRDTGSIPDEAKAALVAKGIPEELIDSYVENAKYRMDNAASESLEYVGGEEEWAKVNQWATENLPPEEQKMYNEMLASDGWKSAVDVLKSKMKASTPTGQEGSLVTGSEMGTGQPIGYTSKAQMLADIQNPLYQTDPAFRNNVARKIAVSTYQEEFNDPFAA